MSDQPVTMSGYLRRALARAGWAERDARATPHLVAVLEWGTGEPCARVILHTGGAAELIELEDGTTVALTRWEQVTPGNVRRITTYLEGAQR